MSAIISDCGKYRYRLGRVLPSVIPGIRTVAFIMVNPSTADAEQDDPTIRRCLGFARKNQYTSLLVGNLFAYRATDVRELAKVRDPVGPENQTYLNRIFGEADLVIAAWGPVTKLPKELRLHWTYVHDLAKRADKPLHCIGTTNSGHPRHPLYTPGDTPLTFWRPPV
jgi:hypothetical protein